MRMGNDASKKQKDNELHVHQPNATNHIVSQMQGSSVDQSTVYVKVKDNDNASLLQQDKHIRSEENKHKGDTEKPVNTKFLKLEESKEGIKDIKIHTVPQEPPIVKTDMEVQQNSGKATKKDAGSSEANIPISVDKTKQESSDEEEPLTKSHYNGQCVFPSQGGKESWQDSDGCISNIFPVEDVTSVDQKPLDKTDSLKPLTSTSMSENKPMIGEIVVKQDNKGGKHVPQDQNCNPAIPEESAVNLNGVSPTIQEAYTEFQALFSYVNDLKLSNRRIMKKLTEEQLKSKKTFEESEAKVSGLEECVKILEDRVSQREGQIKKFKGIIQVLLQKISTLSTALSDVPGNNGRGQGSETSSSSLSEEEEEGLEQKYKLPKPQTDIPESDLPIKQEIGFRPTKDTTTENDNRAGYSEPKSSKVLRRATRQRSKAMVTGTSIKPAEASETRPKHRSRPESQSDRRNEAEEERKSETMKSEANVVAPKARERKPRKTSQRQVPIQNEFRNTLREVTNMTKETSSVPTYDMDLNTWIQEANMEIIKGAESTSPRGVGPNVVLCLDISQSMAGPPFSSMVQGVLQYIDGVENIRLSLGLHINLAIVTFGHQTVVVQHLTNELSILRQTVRNLTPGGTSPLAAGLLMATAASIGHARGVTAGYVHHPRIIIFTDGRATLESRIIGEDATQDGDFSYEVMSNIISVAEDIRRRKTTVSYVPVGNFYSRYMEQIAEVTKGKMYPMEHLDRAIRHSKNFTFAVRLIPIIKRTTGGNLKDESANRLILQNVAKNDPFVTKEDQEDILEIVNNSDELEKSHDSDSEDDEGHREINSDMPPLGSRVRRGPDWSWDSQDSYMAGTVVSHKSDGWLWVMWDSGHRNQYCYGKGGKYDVIPVDEPRTLKPGESIQVGCMVRRGPDWNKGNSDGGDGSMGSVIRVYPNKSLLVRWQNKEILDHNYGCNGKFEVTLCDPSEQLALMMQATYGDGATGGATWAATGNDEMRDGSTESKEREETRKAEQRRTDDVEKEEEDYITKLNRLNQRNVTLGPTPESDTQLPGQSENIPRRGQDKPSGILSSGDRSSSNIPHSEGSRPESSSVQRSNQSSRISMDSHTHREDHSYNISRVSPHPGHSDRVVDNITGSSQHGETVIGEGADQNLPYPRRKRDPAPSGLVTGGAAADDDEADAKVTWQYKDEYGGWTCYSEENSNKIEKTYRKSAKGMTVINGGKHRILLAKMTQVHTTTKHMTAVRRQVK